ncbi:MAG: bifunctional diaminohydroxyphosphoribosylaminopyrimidine deaminase/5-amino-6-(5-phosphoribosylamino)uracil reductase RibD [Litoreibacter sp.]|nr:bifunctional diaminohydroxyphosphoribosylaminopyrimidine deaminase/5-amino-6-(5-phosphoribosylamino)uracil reductase RibD [Litoreibacter sp.]
MQLALSLGARGMGCVWPNPAVGCVIVKDDRVVGRGWTQPGGRPHAEPLALAQAGAAARGATVYVSLEPCAHHGQTPPCSKALIDAGVARVVVATTDPDPRVAGEGLSDLRAAGISVTTGVCETEALRDHAGFLSRISHNRPFLTMKLATSIDGGIATASGESQWITGPDARRVVHAMRARHDAVMIGAGTARADDPSLTVRDLGITRSMVRVVLTKDLDLPLDSKLVSGAAEHPLWIVHGPDVPDATCAKWTDAGARLISVPLGADNQIDVCKALGALATAGLTRVFCEGGGTLAASLLKADMVDDLIGFTAGLSLGGDAIPAISRLGLERLADAPRFALRQVRSVGDDVLHHWSRQQG